MKELIYKTPASWVEKSLNNMPVLLNDHALCEKKAGLNAILFMKYFPDNSKVLTRLSQLAREEFRHYEMVLSFMNKQNISIMSLASCLLYIFKQKRQHPRDEFSID